MRTYRYRHVHTDTDMIGKILLDLHTHTIASGHAYSTMQEMAARASEIGLKILGITEHGPSIPGGTAPLLFEPIVKAAKDAHTLLEINNHSLHPRRDKTEARDNNLEILRLCKKYDVPVILGSDAHISYGIADYSRIWPLLEETAFPDELIMNDKPEMLLDYLRIDNA